MSFWNKKEHVKAPDQNWFKALAEATENTPDIAFLEKKEFQRVFVVDDLMANRRRSEIMTQVGAQKLCSAVTQERFSFWNQRDGSESQVFPLRFDGGFVKPATIRGELYLVPSSGLLILDKAMFNGVWYSRERVKLLIPYRKVTGFVQERTLYDRLVQETKYMDESVSAWMYVGCAAAWNDNNQLTSGCKLKVANGSTDKLVSNINSDGRLYTSVKCFKPHNPKLELYYYFTPYEYASSSK